MNGYLLDTSVISVFAPDRPQPPASLWTWVGSDEQPATWYVPAIAVAEIQKGIAKLRRGGGIERAERLERWLERLVAQFGDRVLPVDAAVARRTGSMQDDAIARGRNPGLPDVLVAATAAEHDLAVLTANLRHFEVLGVVSFDPLTEEQPRRP